jgi:EmrB/QacA subfamily drug resistance transporter
MRHANQTTNPSLSVAIATDGEVVTAARSAARRRWLLLVLAGAATLIVLDATIVNVALPSMGRYFRRDATDMTWAVNAYTLPFGGLLLLGGRSADIFGRRRMLLIGLTVFVAGSLAGGLATTFVHLLIARAFQGAGAAIVSPIALSMIATEFREGAIRNRALAVYSAISGVGGVAGLLVGGALTDSLGWRWVLYVNVVLGLGLIAAIYVVVAESPRSYGHIDVVGGLLSAVGMTGIVYGLIRAASDGWSDSTTIAALSASIGVLAVFALYERFVAAEPMLTLRLFRSVNRSSAYLVILTVAAAFFGMFYFITFFLQGVLGYSALEAGLALVPAAALLAIATQASASLLPNSGPRPLVLGGAAVLGGALVWLSRVSADSSYLNTVLPATLIAAAGLGAVLVPLNVVVLTRVRTADAGLAAAVLNFGQQVGGSIGLAVLAGSAASAATSAGQSVGQKLIAKHGLLSPHVLHFAQLGGATTGGTPAPSDAAGDPIAVHAVHAVQAQAFGAGFQSAALFAGAAVVVGVVGFVFSRARTPEIRSALDDVDRETTA